MPRRLSPLAILLVLGLCADSLHAQKLTRVEIANPSGASACRMQLKVRTRSAGSVR